MGIGAGRQRWRHVRWRIVRDMLIAWATTIPAAAALSIVILGVWKGVSAL